MNKKGYSLQDMAPIAVAFVVIAIVIGIGATVLAGVHTQQLNSFCAGVGGTINDSDAQNVFCGSSTNVSVDAGTDAAMNSTTQGLTVMDTLSGWLPTIGVIVAAAVIIGIIVMYFKF